MSTAADVMDGMTEESTANQINNVINDKLVVFRGPCQDGQWCDPTVVAKVSVSGGGLGTYEWLPSSDRGADAGGLEMMRSQLKQTGQCVCTLDGSLRDTWQAACFVMFDVGRKRVCVCVTGVRGCLSQHCDFLCATTLTVMGVNIKSCGCTRPRLLLLLIKGLNIISSTVWSQIYCHFIDWSLE